jgi:hypothetical protein
MSTVEQITPGDWITGPDETRWRVVDIDEGYVWLEAKSGGDLWVSRDELQRKLVDRTYTHRSEGDQ